MRTAHLFSGLGGGILADLILGHKPVLAIEQDKHCCRVLRARIAEGWLPDDLHVHCGDIQEFDFGPWAGKVDCVAAGTPCQDISIAGSGKGIEGERSGLVWEVFRAIDALSPGCVFLENSPEIVEKGRRDIIRALVARGYSWKDGTLAAADVGAPHIRNRWWLLAANADGKRQLEQERCEQDKWGWLGDGIAKTSGAFRHRLRIAVQRGGLSAASAATIEAAARYTGRYNWAPPDAGICGMVYGNANYLVGSAKGRRIKALGNAQVPLCAAAAWIILSEG